MENGRFVWIEQFDVMTFSLRKLGRFWKFRKLTFGLIFNLSMIHLTKVIIFLRYTPLFSRLKAVCNRVITFHDIIQNLFSSTAINCTDVGSHTARSKSLTTKPIVIELLFPNLYIRYETLSWTYSFQLRRVSRWFRKRNLRRITILF